MSPEAQVLRDLIEELAYIDHEEGTDVAGLLTTLVSQAKEEGLTEDEAAELLDDNVKLMQLNSVLVDDEHLRLVQDVVRNLLDVLFA